MHGVLPPELHKHRAAVQVARRNSISGLKLAKDVLAIHPDGLDMMRQEWLLIATRNDNGANIALPKGRRKTAGQIDVEEGGDPVGQVDMALALGNRNALRYERDADGCRDGG